MDSKNDLPLAGFRERVLNATKENPNLKTLLYKRQAHIELLDMLEQFKHLDLSPEEKNKLLIYAYRGTNLCFQND